MTKPREPSWRHGVVLAASWLLCACQVMFGDYRAGHRDAGVGSGVGGNESGSLANTGGDGGNGGGAEDTGDAATPACDSDGTYLCTGTALEICQDPSMVPPGRLHERPLRRGARALHVLRARYLSLFGMESRSLRLHGRQLDASRHVRYRSLVRFGLQDLSRVPPGRDLLQRYAAVCLQPRQERLERH